MRILERYINNSILKTFALCVLIFCFMYILIDATDMLDEIIDRGISVNVLVKYYLAYMPVILVQMASIACLIASLLTYSQLHTHNEIIAIRASGLNFWQVTKPALFFAMIVSCSIFILSEQWVPRASARAKEIRNESMILKVDREKKKKEKIRNLTFYGMKNRLFFVDTFDPHEETLKGITIIEYDNDQKIQQKIVAYKGVWTGLAWKFYQCQITAYGPGGLMDPVKMKIYKEKLMDIKETPKDFLKQHLNVSMMNIRQLHNYIQRFANSGAARALNNLRVDLHQKIAYPFGNFVIVFTGLPFVLMIRSRKRSAFTAVGLAILIGFLYYVATALALAFGKGGLLSPVLSAWVAPALFAGVTWIVVKVNF